MPTALLLLTLPLHIAMNIASLVWFSLNGKGRVIFRSKRDAIRRIPGVLRRRNPGASRAIWPLLAKGGR